MHLIRNMLNDYTYLVWGQDQVKLKDASEIEYFHIRLMTYTEKRCELPVFSNFEITQANYEPTSFPRVSNNCQSHFPPDSRN